MTMTNDQALARIAQLEALLAAANKPKSLSIKIGDKGTVCVYGLGRFPVSLYGTQWQRVAEYIPTIMAFLKANPQTMLTKADRTESKPVTSLADHLASRQASGLQT